MTGEHLDWDNLRYFLAVARAGKLTAAARRLGQDHTTVGRRIASLESAFRSKLFERRPEGYRLTETGQRLYENVKTLESSVWEIQRDLVGQTQHVEGVVRMGAPDDFGNLFLAKHIGELQSLHPGLKIELITLPYTLSVSKREADISIGVERPAEGRLFVRRLTDFEMRLYATRDYIDAHGPIDRPSDLATQTWIGPVSDFNSTTIVDAATELDCTPTLRFACSSFAGQLAAAINGVGVAMLPRYVADQEKSLAPVLPDIVKTMRAYHMVVHADLRDLPRVRTVTNYIGQKVTEARALFVPSPTRSNQSKTSSLPTWLAPEALMAVAGQARESASALGRLKPAALADAVRLSAVSG
jgi:DNA-binding transcriptional LysR family regulator